MKYTCQQNIQNQLYLTERLVLNEVFAAEKDVGKISVYTLKVDGFEIEGGKIRSSGIIISTGTGSSGWLLSARRMS